MQTNIIPKNIAIANNCTIVRDGIVSLLKTEWKYNVIIEVENGKELIEKLMHCSIKPDVCIMEIDMPEMNGLETAKWINNNIPDMAIVILTGVFKQHYIYKMIVNNVYGIVLKTDTTNVLNNAIIAVYNNRKYFSIKIAEQINKFIIHGDIKLPHLSITEFEVLKLCCKDYSYKEIAQLMNITLGSVEGHKDALYRKLNVHTRIGLMLFAIKNGIIQINIECENGANFYAEI